MQQQKTNRQAKFKKKTNTTDMTTSVTNWTVFLTSKLHTINLTLNKEQFLKLYLMKQSHQMTISVGKLILKF